MQLNRLARPGPRRYLPSGHPFLLGWMAAALLALQACGGEPRPVPQPRTESPGEAAAPRPDCGVTERTRVTEDAIADLAIGAPVGEIVRACQVLRDTVEVRQEGMPARILTVNLGRDTVEAEVSEERIWRIALDGPAFQTADSLGVGTRLDRLLRHEGIHGMPGEDGFYVRMPAHCGLSFRVEEGGKGFAAPEWTAEMLAKLPPDTRVDRVLVVGCGP